MRKLWLKEICNWLPSKSTEIWTHIYPLFLVLVFLPYFLIWLFALSDTMFSCSITWKCSTLSHISLVLWDQRDSCWLKMKLNPAHQSLHRKKKLKHCFMKRDVGKNQRRPPSSFPPQDSPPLDVHPGERQVSNRNLPGLASSRHRGISVNMSLFPNLRALPSDL